MPCFAMMRSVVQAFCFSPEVIDLATKPFKPCAHPGCRELVKSGYCDKHRPADRQRRSAEAASWHKWYQLPIWKDDLRPAQLLREPFCRSCSTRAQREGLPHLARVKATDVDHIKPHRGNWALFVDPNNHQSLCHACHSRKTAAEMAQKRNEFLL